MPSLAGSPTIDIPYNTPLVIGSLRIEKTGPVDLGQGSYTFVFQRQFALRPTINKQEEALYAEIGHFALKSNTISITILPGMEDDCRIARAWRTFWADSAVIPPRKPFTSNQQEGSRNPQCVNCLSKTKASRMSKFSIIENRTQFS